MIFTLFSFSCYRHILRVFGLTGAETTTEWTPPSCVLTTPPPTTTQSPEAVGLGQAETLEALLAENDQLRAKVSILLALQMFHPLIIVL